MYADAIHTDDSQFNPAFDPFISKKNIFDGRLARPSLVTDINSSEPPSHRPLDIPQRNAQDSSFNTFQTSRSFSPSYSQDNDVVSSPAAMFLSAFSSPSAPPVLPDSEGQVVSGYTLGPIIGYGGFSIIRKASSSSGGVVAVKIVRRSDIAKHSNPSLARRRLMREADVWASLSHEHILPLFSAEHTLYADFFFTLYCPAGSLYDILKRDGFQALPQDDAGMMFRQVVRGLRYMHQVAMYVHRDIKLENVLVDEMGVCRIGDFGMTRKIGELDEDDFVGEDEGEQDEQHQEQPLVGAAVHRVTSLHQRRHTKSGLPVHLSMIRHNQPRHRNSTPAQSAATMSHHLVHVFQPGSLPYAAPELLLPSSTPVLPHPAQDIWALGVLLYALLTGCLPFSDSFEPRLQMKILHGVYEVPAGIGRGAERVLQGCLDRSVQSRWTIDMIDEVGWGVGWGSEGDDVTPEESDSEVHSCPITPVSRSRSRPRPADIIIPENPKWQQGDVRPRSSIEAAQRRSSSRAKRSLSRAPVLNSRSTSARRSADRSVSRPPQPTPPCLAALSNSILRTKSGSSSSSDSPFDESALVTSPSPSRERGRRLKKLHTSSRSPSPSAVPTTPVDYVDRFRTPLDALHEREPSRGRTKYGRLFRSAGDEESLFDNDGGPSTDLDVLEESSRWAMQLKPGLSAEHALFAQRGVSRGRSNDAHSPMREFEQSRPARRTTEAFFATKRAGSTPPAPVTPWSKEDGTGSLRFAEMPPLQHHREGFSGTGCGGSGRDSGVLTPGKGLRSRSVGPRPREEALMAFGVTLAKT